MNESEVRRYGRSEGKRCNEREYKEIHKLVLLHLTCRLHITGQGAHRHFDIYYFGHGMLMIAFRSEIVSLRLLPRRVSTIAPHHVLT